MFGRLDDNHELLLVFGPEAGRLSAHLTPEHSDHFFLNIFLGDFFIFSVLYSTLLHLPLDLIRTRLDLIRTVIIGQENVR
jgi:hypothetical protein